MQLVYLSPVLVPVWFAGMRRIWRDASRWARSFVLAYPLLCAALLIVGGKPYYPVPLLLVFLAAGAEPAMAAVRWFVHRRVHPRQDRVRGRASCSRW